MQLTLRSIAESSVGWKRGLPEKKLLSMALFVHPARWNKMPKVGDNGAAALAYPGRKESSRHGEATSCVFEHRLRLLSGDAGEPIKELLQPRAGLEVLEKRFDGNTRAPENPGTTHPVRRALDSGALRPVQHEVMVPGNPALSPGFARGLESSPDGTTSP